jgi:predicted enzyme related to lactoylglutathione lyase
VAKVLGVGGVFFKSADVGALAAWYGRVLGVEIGEWGGFFPATGPASKPGAGTVYSPFPATTTSFAPSTHDFMINLMVDDLDGVLARAAAEGVAPVHRLDESYGRFAHILDPEGRKLELWEPLAPPDAGAGSDPQQG